MTGADHTSEVSVAEGSGTATPEPKSSVVGERGARAPRIVVLEHDPDDPPMLLGDWLTEAGAQIELRRLHAGDAVPADPGGFDALVSMGGEMGAWDDDLAPWLPATRSLLAAAATVGTPTLAVCLGAQLLAAATGGRVERGADGPEIGAYLVAKRDAAEADPLFAGLPLSPDVMHHHDDVISALPPGGVLLLSSTGYPNQAFRIGSAAWGIQFHIEASAAALRGWSNTAQSRRCGPMLDEAAEMMGQVWRAFAHRFVQLVRDGVPPSPAGRAGPRLPLLTDESTGPR